MLNELRLMVTDSCPYTCTFCHNEWQPQGKTFLEFNLAIALSRAAMELGVRHYYLSGGEPLSHPEIVPLLSELRRRLPTAELGVATNFSINRSGWLDACQETDTRLRINLPSLDPDRYQKYTGGGQLDRVLGNLKRARAVGIRTGINTVWLGQPREDLTALIAFAARLGGDLKFLLWNQGPDLPEGAPSGELRSFLENCGQLRTNRNSVARYEVSTDDGPVRVRVIDVPCLTSDRAACRSFGEVRLLASGRLQGCIHHPAGIISDLSPSGLRSSLLAAASTRGYCLGGKPVVE